MHITVQRFGLCIVVLLTGLIGFASPGHADVQPGDTITKDNIAQAETLLTPSTRWMVERGMPIQVIATKKVTWPKAYEDATEKFAAQVEIADDGSQIFNYVAGCPFPSIDPNDPLAAYRVMWNHEQSPYFIDNAGAHNTIDIVDSQGGVARTYEFPWRRLMWTGRLYTDPKPVLPHAPAVRHTNLLGPLVRTQEYKGLAILFFRYLAPETPDDGYVYVPEHRRVRRIGWADRSGALGGTDFDLDSFYGFNGNIAHWTFRVLADKDILAVVHSGKYGDPSAWCAPRDGQHGILAALPCVSWEKRRVWVIEATPTAYPGSYAFSKRILYIDQEFFAPVLQEMYDNQGELWKAMLLAINYTSKPYASYPTNPVDGGKYNYTDEWMFTPNWLLLDLQEVVGTAGENPVGNQPQAEWYNEWYFNEDVSSNQADIYSTNYLIRSAR